MKTQKGIRHSFCPPIFYILIGQTGQAHELLKVGNYATSTFALLCFAQCLAHDQWPISCVEVMNEKLQYEIQEVSGKGKINFE